MRHTSYRSPAEIAAREAANQAREERGIKMDAAREVRGKFLRTLIGSQKVATKHTDILTTVAARWPRPAACQPGRPVGLAVAHVPGVRGRRPQPPRRDPGRELRSALTVTDLEVRKLAEAAKIDIRSVAFGGGGAEAFKALVGGQVNAVAGRAATFAGGVDAGDVGVLATFGDRPFEAVPGAVPTGALGYHIGNTPEIVGIGAPQGLPPEVKTRLADASLQVEVFHVRC